MTFEIDTGPAIRPHTPLDYVDDWFLDDYPEPYDEGRIVHDFAFNLIGKLQSETGPVKLETARKHFLAKWVFIRHLADIHPDIFDELMMAYSERVQRT